jgi:sterol 14alpha-demethylase
MTLLKPTPPALPGLPVLGNLIGFARNRHTLLRQGTGRFGRVFSFRLGPKNVAALIGPEYHELFFAQTDKALSIEKPYENLAALFGKVMFLAPRDRYIEQRPILQVPFGPEKMRKYLGIMQAEVQQWIDSLGDSGERELVSELGRLVQTVAGNALMGADFQKKVGREFWDLYAVLAQSLNLAVPPHWPLPRNWRRERAKRRMRELLEPIIVERRQHPERYDDFLQDFVQSRGKSGAPADDETLIGLITALMFASHETTAGQATWTIAELLRNPGYLALVEADIAAALPAGTPIDGTRLRNMPHVAWAVREVERLHPSADILLRLALEDIELPEHRIPAGWLVLVSAALAHRASDLFADPDRFDPLRFAPGRAEDHKHMFSLIGFGGGQHKCTGMNFANNEMMIIAALLFQQMDVELLTHDPGTELGLGAPRPTPTRIRYRRKRMPTSEERPVATTARA